MEPSDWETVFHNNSLPYTCCENIHKTDQCFVNSDKVHKEGCLPKLKDILESKAYIVGSVGVGIGLVQVSKHFSYVFLGFSYYCPFLADRCRIRMHSCKIN